MGYTNYNAKNNSNKKNNKQQVTKTYTTTGHKEFLKHSLMNDHHLCSRTSLSGFKITVHMYCFSKWINISYDLSVVSNEKFSAIGYFELYHTIFPLSGNIFSII